MAIRQSTVNGSSSLMMWKMFMAQLANEGRVGWSTISRLDVPRVHAGIGQATRASFPGCQRPRSRSDLALDVLETLERLDQFFGVFGLRRGIVIHVGEHEDTDRRLSFANPGLGQQVLQDLVDTCVRAANFPDWIA